MSIARKVKGTIQSCHFDCIEQVLSRIFARYARFISHHPVWFLTIPCIVSALICLRFLKPINILTDDITLYTPSDGRAMQDRQHLGNYFPIPENNSVYWLKRYDKVHTGYIIVTRAPVQELNTTAPVNLLHSYYLSQIVRLWLSIAYMPIYKYNDMYDYTKMCVRLGDQNAACLQNLLISELNLHQENTDSVSYPYTKVTVEGQSRDVFIGNLLGGVTTDETTGIIQSCEAILLPYALRHDTAETEDLATLWEEQLSVVLKDFQSDDLAISWWTYQSMVEETKKDRQRIVLMMGPLFFIISTFTILCSFTQDSITSKPFLALFGVGSAFLGILIGVALLQIFNIPMTSVVCFMPFIVFCIGVDDVFILLAAWRRTSPNLPVPQRMEETFKEAGVSITVTSMTDSLSFAVGCITTFPAVWIFCAYAALAITLVYIYQMSFFAAAMVFSGRHEEKRKGWVVCSRWNKWAHEEDDEEEELDEAIIAYPVLKSDAPALPVPEFPYKQSAPDDDQSKSVIWLAYKGLYEKIMHKLHQLRHENDNDPSNANDMIVSWFFKGPYSSFLANSFVQVGILVVYFLYLILTAYGCTRLQIGLLPNEVLPYDSYASRYLSNMQQYFYAYADNLHLWFSNMNERPFTLPDLDKLEAMVNRFEYTTYTLEDYNSWIPVFRLYLANTELSTPIDNTTDLSPIISNHFLTFVADNKTYFQDFQPDFHFDANGRLQATRFMIMLRNFGYVNHTNAMHLLRGIADGLSVNNALNAEVDVFHDFFIFAQQQDEMVGGLVQNIGIAGFFVIMVSLLLIPNPVCSFWVCYSLASITVGIVGLMALWGVKLSFASLITIDMSIGFTVDFSAHVAYHYSKDKHLTPEERIREAMYGTATPVLQGAVCTILGVTIMCVVKNYVAITFVKTIVLAISLGAIHAVVFLPVILTITDRIRLALQLFC